MKKRRIATLILSFLLALQLIVFMVPVNSRADSEDVAEHVRAVMETGDSFDHETGNEASETEEEIETVEIISETMESGTDESSSETDGSATEIETEQQTEASDIDNSDVFTSGDITWTAVGEGTVLEESSNNFGIMPLSLVGSGTTFSVDYTQVKHVTGSFTYRTTVTTDTGTYNAFCGDALNTCPAPGVYTIYSGSGLNSEVLLNVKTVFVLGEGGIMADAYRDQIFGTGTSADYRYGMTHEMISILTSGQFSRRAEADARRMIEICRNIYNSDANVRDAVSRTSVYMINPDKPVNSNGISTQTMYWAETAPATGSIRVTKVSANSAYTASAQAASRFPLAGISVGLYTDAGCTNRVASAATNAQGVASFNDVHVGSYYVREDALPANTLWVRNTQARAVTVTGGGTATTTITNQAQSGFLQVRKTSADTTITAPDDPGCYNYAGIQFYVYRDSACTSRVSDIGGNPIVLTTNAAGITNTAAILPGTYFVKEVSIPDGAGWDTDNMPQPVRAVISNAGTSANASNTTVVTVENKPLNDPAGIVITKYDAVGNLVPGYDLSGAQYRINYYNGQYGSVSALPSVPSASWVVETAYDEGTGRYIADLDADHVVEGEAVYGMDQSTGAFVIPLGTLTIQEIKAPQYMSVTGRYEASGAIEVDSTNHIALFNIVDNHSVVDVQAGGALIDTDSALPLNMYEDYACGGLVIDKNDSDTNGAPQGDADLAGIRYAIFSNIDRSILVDGLYYEEGDLVGILTTDEAGNAQTGMNHLPLGTYTVRELRMDAEVTEDADGRLNITSEGSSDRANMYYAYDGAEQTVEVTSEGSGVTASFENEAARMQIAVRKFDADTGTQIPEGGAILEGIRFDLINRSVRNQAVVVDDEAFAYGEVVATAYTDEAGFVDFGVELPYGTYGVQEVLSENNDSYLISDGEEHIITPSAMLTDDGAVVYSFNYSDPRAEEDTVSEYEAFYNYVVRGGVEFTKVDDEGEPIGLVPFRITNVETGEVHYIITNEDGFFSTEVYDCTANTNGNDGALEDYTEADIIPMEVLESLDLEAGTWFGNGEPDDEMYALPYGTYTVEELKCEHTAFMNMASFTFTIEYQGQLDYYGDVENIPVEIYTTALGAETQEHYAPAAEECVIIDTVEYINLIPGVEYVVDGTLMLVVDEDEVTPVTNADGTPVTGQTVFTPEEANGTVDVTFTFDAAAVEGHDTVVFESVHKTLTGEFVAEHKDPTDEGQIVHIPKVHTTALAGDTEDHISKADEDVTIVDTVEYYGLPAGEEYVVTGTLIDKATGAALPDNDGNAITASTTFVAEEENGTANVTFNFSGVNVAGKTTVVFEEIRRDGILYAIHADLNDTDQTVVFPAVRTTAVGDAGEDRVSVSESAVITDVVEYTNLLPGRTYVVTGSLINKSTGEAVPGCTETVEFVPETADGSVDVTFTVDTTTLQGAQLVVFEDVSIKIGEELFSIGEHRDLDDEGQTVTVDRETIPTTGDSYHIGVYVCLMIVSVVAMAVSIIVIRNAKKKRC